MLAELIANENIKQSQRRFIQPVRLDFRLWRNIVIRQTKQEMLNVFESFSKQHNLAVRSRGE